MTFADVIAMCALILGAICIVGMGLDAYKRRLSHREKELELKVRMAEAERGAGTQRLGDMEDRLRILERIATDPTHALSHEIESLRQPHAAKEIAR